MKRRAALLNLALLPLAASAQVRLRSQTMTRLVRRFLDLETALIDALRDRDGAAAGRLLSEDFEQRDAAHPGEPIPRAEWLASALGQWPGETWLEQMAVHDRGDTMLVSFLARPSAGPARFLVDVWVRAGDGWRLQVRYSSP
jgi:hypothetical protein